MMSCICCDWEERLESRLIEGDDDTHYSCDLLWVICELPDFWRDLPS